MSALPDRRPIGPVYINRNNYFGSRVLAYWPLDGTQLFDYASPSPGSVSGTNGAGSSSNNSRYFKGDGSSYVVLPKSPFKDNTSPVSIAFFQRRDAAALYDGLFSTMPPGASSRFCLGWGSDAAYRLFVGSSSSSIPSIPIAQPANGVEARVVVVCAGGPSSITAGDYVGFANGTKYTQSTRASFTNQTATTHVIAWDGADSKHNGLFGDFVVFDGALSDAAAFEYLRNPYQFLIPYPLRRVFIGAPAASIPALSAATYKSGTLTSAGFTPEVTAS